MADDEFEEQLRQETIAKASGEDLEGRTYTDADGTVYEWDVQKKAWFPKIDDDFIAKYQMNYGTDDNNADSADQQSKESNFVEYPDFNPPNNDPNSEEYYNYYYEYFSKYGQAGDAQPGTGPAQEGDASQGETSSQSQEAQGIKRPANKQEGWFDFDTEKGTHVYVSGLPLDITAEEFRELMHKYGLIMYDHQTRQPKIKLYMDEHGQPKGDGLCVFIKPESVELCLKLLDGLELRGSTVHAERATFTMKGNYDPSKKRKKLSNKEKRKLKEKQEKLFAWNPERLPDARLKHEQVVILKNMFDPHDFDEDPSLINDVVEDVRSEAARFGDVKKVNIYDQHPDGVVTVKFKDAEMADACIAAMNGRFFAKRRILAAQWDGKARFEVQESEAERQARLDRWAAFLEGKKAKQEQAERDKAAKAQQAAAAASAAEGTASTVEPASSSSDPPTGGQDTPDPQAPVPNPPPAPGEGVEKNTQGASQPS